MFSPGRAIHGLYYGAKNNCPVSKTAHRKRKCKCWTETKVWLDNQVRGIYDESVHNQPKEHEHVDPVWSIREGCYVCRGPGGCVKTGT
jgi:hypothetical protein